MLDLSLSTEILHKIWKLCTKFGHLILRKNHEICCHKRPKCTQFNFGCGDPARGAYSAPPDLIAEFNGAYF